MSVPNFRFKPVRLPASTEKLREEVRAFIAAESAAGRFTPTPGGWWRFDMDMTRRLGARGWIGMTWPRRYGGHEKSAADRYVVTEELLAAGVPILAHYPADRQLGPVILRYGSEELKQRFLPRIAAGECACSIGLSEPDSGSDLAAITTRATRVDGGWRVEGRKLWTSYAHCAHVLAVLLRTSPRADDNRRGGMSRFLIETSSPGITIRPVTNMIGVHELNEVMFDGVFVPDAMVIGEVGGAWSQLGSELAYERSAPDRWLASFDTLKQLIDQVGPEPERRASEVTGRFVAHLWTLRAMSLSISGMIERGEVPNVEAAVVKDLGTILDQEIPHAARALIGEDIRGRAAADSPFNRFLNYDLLFAPALSIRGGTREILRNEIARGLGLR